MHGLRGAVAAIWVLGCVAGFFYARSHAIPAHIAVPVALAFLIELSLYASLGRDVLVEPWHFFVAGLLPYGIYSVATGVFAIEQFAMLAGLCALLSWWLALIPSLDLLFLAIVAAIQISGLYRDIYASPWQDLRVYPLGQLMLFRTGIGTMLAFRERSRAGFGFLPSVEHWKTGLRYFVYLAPAALAVNWLIGFVEPRLVTGFWWKAPATFFGILWVVALGEEFFFRGTLLPWLTPRIGAAPALIATSVAFGSVHLWATSFPNWKFSLLAAVAGLFYGRAFLATGSIRSAMVAHALTVTMWRTFFVAKATSAL